MAESNETVSTTQRWPKGLLLRAKKVAKAERRSVSNLTIVIMEEGLAERERRNAVGDAGTTTSTFD